MSELEIPPALIDENRVGDVVLAKQLLRDNPQLMDDLGKAMYVVSMRQFAEQDELKFTAFCAHFEPHDKKYLCPRYVFDQEAWLKDGTIRFTKAVKPLSLAEMKKFREMPKKVNGG